VVDEAEVMISLTAIGFEVVRVTERDASLRIDPTAVTGPRAGVLGTGTPFGVPGARLSSPLQIFRNAVAFA
jgi:hypothetical protein